MRIKTTQFCDYRPHMYSVCFSVSLKTVYQVLLLLQTNVIQVFLKKKKIYEYSCRLFPFDDGLFVSKYKKINIFKRTATAVLHKCF